MQYQLLSLATICFLISVLWTLYTFSRGGFRPGRVNFLVLSVGFALQSYAIYLRGLENRSCPINSLYEVLLFVSWSIVLIYLVIGSVYRLSLMGAFTAPLVFLLNAIALWAPFDRTPRIRETTPWLELHAALSLLAYGAFGLACVASIMYLVQERQLKSKTPGRLAFSLPPITNLMIANKRLLLLGVVILAVGIFSGFVVDLPVDGLKFLTSIFLLVLYVALLALERLHGLSASRVAGASVGIFVFAMASLPLIQFLSVHPLKP